uniref:Uncharacterized protein n=1 Tax=Globisporangium ultimum (strain ATCC 200006 / CBS 805.95 / DAOM BR144) TaxID=431595 RepID=K3WQ96_GLOUD
MSSVISRFNVVIVNFIFVRVLIPHIILHPHEIDIGSGNMSKQTASNLKALATMLYQICGLISPVPPPESNSSIARKSSISLSSRPEPEAISSPPADEKEKVASSETRFFSIEEIGSLLIPSPTFPAEDPQVQKFAREQQVCGMRRQLCRCEI